MYIPGYNIKISILSRVISSAGVEGQGPPSLKWQTSQPLLYQELGVAFSMFPHDVASNLNVLVPDVAVLVVFK